MIKPSEETKPIQNSNPDTSQFSRISFQNQIDHIPNLSMPTAYPSSTNQTQQPFSTHIHSLPEMNNTYNNHNLPSSQTRQSNDALPRESPQMRQLKNNLHFLYTESDEKNNSNFHFNFSPHHDNEATKSKKLTFKLSSAGSIVKNLNSSARKEYIHSSVKKLTEEKDKDYNSSANKVTYPGYTGYSFKSPEGYSSNNNNNQKKTKLILSSQLVPGNLLDLSCLTDTFYRENLALNVNENNCVCPKFVKSLATNMVASLNDDIQKKKVELEKKENVKEVQAQQGRIDLQQYESMAEKSQVAMNTRHPREDQYSLKVERERMNLNFGCNQHEQYDN